MGSMHEITVDEDVKQMILDAKEDYRICTACTGPALVPIKVKPPKKSDIMIPIGDYVLSDITGRVVAKGRCQDTSLTLDLSNQKEGMYLLELLIEEKTLIYKIIKQ